MSSNKILIWTANTITLALVAVLGLQIAWWTWRVISPPSLMTAQDNVSINPSLARTLFGDAGSAGDSATITASSSGITLKGVYAVDGKTLSAAVLNGGSKDQAVVVGGEIQSGVKLIEVHADHVFISRNGVRERIDLDQHMRSSGSAVLTAAGGSFRLNVTSPNSGVYSLSRQELNTVLQDPRQLNFLGRIGPAANGGVRVEDAPGGSLSDKLGLKAGDLLTSVNGQPVNSAGDLARLYSQFGTLNQIRAEIMRGGSPMLLTYTIQN
jgi:general secretion pathway protein C